MKQYHYCLTIQFHRLRRETILSKMVTMLISLNNVNFNPLVPDDNQNTHSEDIYDSYNDPLIIEIQSDIWPAGVYLELHYWVGTTGRAKGGMKNFCVDYFMRDMVKLNHGHQCTPSVMIIPNKSSPWLLVT